MQSSGLLRRAPHAVEGLAPVVVEPALLDRPPRARRQFEQEAQIMQRQKAQPEQLVLVDEVADVRAGEARAGWAAAGVVERRGIAREARVLEVQASLPGQRRSRAAEPRRPHA